MGEPRLSSPRLTVIRDGQEPLTLQTNNMDLVRWDRTRVKHKWPRLDEAPFLWFTFISWSAARRTGAIPDTVTYEVWESTVQDVNAEDDEGDESSDVGRPFPEIPGHV
jgi:hypothetical protein